MTVKEMIEKLEKMDEDLEVVVRSFSEGDDYSSVEVEESVSDGQDSAVILFFT